jgi:hypothetical protein
MNKIDARFRADRRVAPPARLGRVGFPDLRIKLTRATAASSAIELPKACVDVPDCAWRAQSRRSAFT